MKIFAAFLPSLTWLIPTYLFILLYIFQELFLTSFSILRVVWCPSWRLRNHTGLFPILSCFTTAAAAKSLQSCPALCNPIDGSPPGSRPWDSPGKNTGEGCHSLLQCMKVKSESKVAQLCLTRSDPMDCSLPGSSVHRTTVCCNCVLL